MDEIKSLSYLPRASQDQELFLSVTALLDRAINNGYVPELNKLSNIYNPSNPNYDPYEIIKLLGGNSLSNLLSNFTDETSVALILSDLHNIKGTEAGFIAILKLLKLNFQTLKYSVQSNGCTDVTIILDPNSRLDINDVIQLEQFTRELFPINLTLVGVTNCLANGITALGNQTLDYQFVLGSSKMNGTYGTLLPEVSDNIRFFLCTETNFDLNVDVETVHQMIQSRVRSRDFVFTRTFNFTLDRGLILGGNTYIDFLPFAETLRGILYSHSGHIRGNLINSEVLKGYQTTWNTGVSELLDFTIDALPGKVFTSDIVSKRRINLCHGANILGWYNLGTDMHPLSGAPNTNIWSNGLDNMRLGYSTLDNLSKVVISNCQLSRRVDTANYELPTTTDELRIVVRTEEPLWNNQVVDSHSILNKLYDLSVEIGEGSFDTLVSRSIVSDLINEPIIIDSLSIFNIKSTLDFSIDTYSYDILDYDDTEYFTTTVDTFSVNHTSQLV